MNNFNLQIELEDNILYISNECGSGAEYEVNNIEDILKYIEHYIKLYC